jgi:hypothetical protein
MDLREVRYEDGSESCPLMGFGTVLYLQVMLPQFRLGTSMGGNVMSDKMITELLHSLELSYES